MIRGVGTLRTMRGKNAGAAKELERTVRDHVAATVGSRRKGAPARATLVKDGERVVLVEEWSGADEREVYAKEDGPSLDELVRPLVREPPTTEFFPEALHVHADGGTSNDVGILVRQTASGAENGARLRDAQRDAYERQMKLEPGCTCCIILADGSDTVRIVELWKTMADFYIHESSEWHDEAEKRVVPLVVDMDCDFVDGSRLWF